MRALGDGGLLLFTCPSYYLLHYGICNLFSYPLNYTVGPAQIIRLIFAGAGYKESFTLFNLHVFCKFLIMMSLMYIKFALYIFTTQ